MRDRSEADGTEEESAPLLPMSGARSRMPRQGTVESEDRRLRQATFESEDRRLRQAHSRDLYQTATLHRTSSSDLEYGTIVGTPDFHQPHRRDFHRRLSTEVLRDQRREFLDHLLQHPDFHDPRINRKDLPDIMIYKGRPLASAGVLHLAVWCAAHLHEASLVDLVLAQMEGTAGTKAKYQLPSREEGWTVELRLDALHIACGLGSLPAVSALIRHALRAAGQTLSPTATPTPSSKPSWPVREYINQYTVKYSQSTANSSVCRVENFYNPLHEALDKGFTEVAAYLLQHGADGAAANLDGMAPLHFLAMRGSNGELYTGDFDGLRRVVQALQDAGGSLEKPVSDKHWNPKVRGRTPLQLAAADDSRFPRQMMGLLVPCLQENSVSEPRYFQDIAFLTALDAEAATDVVREIRARAARNPSVLLRFRLDAQLKPSSPGEEKRTDLIARILFLAPAAGGLMLDMLVGDPIVQDVSKHNIPTRTSLYGFWRHLPMRCIYRPDVDSRENISLPIWSFETDKPLEKQPQIAWHSWLVPQSDGLTIRTDYVYNISVNTLLMPNILDLDMFVALGRARQPKIFSRLSVQGMIYCLWNNLVDSVWLAELIFYLVELVVLMWWALAWPVVGPRHSIKADKPLCWAIITAGAMRETVQLAWGMNGCLRKYTACAEPTMRSMWHPLSALFVQWAIPKVVTLLVQLRFAWGSREDLGESELSELDQVLLATTVLLKAMQVIYSFRLCAGGSKIYAIVNSFLGGATREMLCIVGMIFGSFSLAFLVLAQDKGVAWVLASSYRGLLFGDGDGFSNLGLPIEQDVWDHSSMLTVFLVMGSFIFNIILMNLIIAVYGNEYDKVVGVTPLLFLQGRAKYCVLYVLSCQLFPWTGPATNRALKVLSFVLLLMAIGLHIWRRRLESWELSTASLFGLAQLLFQAALAQCEWFSIDGSGAGGKEHFLWMCYRDTNKEQDLHSETLQVGTFEEKIAALRKHVDGRMGSLEAKLDAILDRLCEPR